MAMDPRKPLPPSESPSPAAAAAAVTPISSAPSSSISPASSSSASHSASSSAPTLTDASTFATEGPFSVIPAVEEGQRLGRFQLPAGNVFESADDALKGPIKMNADQPGFVPNGKIQLHRFKRALSHNDVLPRDITTEVAARNVLASMAEDVHVHCNSAGQVVCSPHGLPFSPDISSTELATASKLTHCGVSLDVFIDPTLAKPETDGECDSSKRLSYIHYRLRQKFKHDSSSLPLCFLSRDPQNSHGCRYSALKFHVIDNHMITKTGKRSGATPIAAAHHVIACPDLSSIPLEALEKMAMCQGPAGVWMPCRIQGEADVLTKLDKPPPEYNVWVICRLLDELIDADETSFDDAVDAARYLYDFHLHASELNETPDGFNPRSAMSLLTIGDCDVARLCSMSLLQPQPARGLRMTDYWDEVTSACNEIEATRANTGVSAYAIADLLNDEPALDDDIPHRSPSTSSSSLSSSSSSSPMRRREKFRKKKQPPQKIAIQPLFHALYLQTQIQVFADIAQCPMTTGAAAAGSITIFFEHLPPTLEVELSEALETNADAVKRLAQQFTEAAHFPPIKLPTYLGHVSGVLPTKGAQKHDVSAFVNLPMFFTRFSIELRDDQSGNAIAHSFAGWIKTLRERWALSTWFNFKFLHVPDAPGMNLMGVLPGQVPLKDITTKWLPRVGPKLIKLLQDEPCNLEYKDSSRRVLPLPRNHPSFVDTISHRHRHFLLFSWDEKAHSRACLELRKLFRRHVSDTGLLESALKTL